MWKPCLYNLWVVGFFVVVSFFLFFFLFLCVCVCVCVCKRKIYIEKRNKNWFMPVTGQSLNILQKIEVHGFYFWSLSPGRVLHFLSVVQFGIVNFLFGKKTTIRGCVILCFHDKWWKYFFPVFLKAENCRRNSIVLQL